MFTKEECKQMIDLYIEAEKSILTGKRYRIGTRELEREDLDDVVKHRVEWERRLQILENDGKSRKIRGIIPRDL